MPPRAATDGPPAGAERAAERTFAHVSDLHLGSGEQAEQGARELADALVASGVGHVVLTGDVTHRGRADELDRFRQVFQPLAERRALTVVPGNHDRMNDDVRDGLMPGERVQRVDLDGLSIVRVDSTAPHNRALHKGHGVLGGDDLEAIDRALASAPQGALVALALHHHPLPLPPESLDEVLTCFVGLPWCAELRDGRALLDRLLGRCDLVLHGHRHVASEQRIRAVRHRPLGIYNAGRSPSLGRFRVFRHARGRLIAPPRWMGGDAEAAKRAGPAR